MTNVAWSIVKIAAQLLPRDERDAALGDLLETNESAWNGLLDVVGLVLHRQAILWKSWRPWLAAFGLTLPNSFLLMGASVSLSQTFLRLTGNQEIRNQEINVGWLTSLNDLVHLVCQAVVLLACAWAGGFVATSLSRRTLWVSASLCTLACLSCLATFRIESLSSVSLLLFLLPAILGVRRGLGTTQLKPAFAIVLALAATLLMVQMWGGGTSLVLSWALLWPAWFLVVTARGYGNKSEPA